MVEDNGAVHGAKMPDDGVRRNGDLEVNAGADVAAGEPGTGTLGQVGLDRGARGRGLDGQRDELQLFIGLGAFFGLDENFILVPGPDLDAAIDVVEGEFAVGVEGAGTGNWFCVGVGGFDRVGEQRGGAESEGAEKGFHGRKRSAVGDEECGCRIGFWAEC